MSNGQIVMFFIFAFFFELFTIPNLAPSTLQPPLPAKRGETCLKLQTILENYQKKNDGHKVWESVNA